MSVGELVNREERPAYVRFERRPIEDVPATKRDGVYRAKDVDFALVTPPYSKDCVEYKVTQWLENMERNVRDGRIPERWAEQWKESYTKWKNGQEMPLHGTPIRGWGVISPAQQSTMIAMSIMTVEDLSSVNDEGLRRIGMGAIELRDKARNWLASVKDHGAVTVQMTALQQENSQLKTTLDALQKQVDALKSMVNAEPQYVPRETNEITASDVLEDFTIPTIGDATVKRKPGRPSGSGKRVAK